MQLLMSFARFWYDFIIGDDWSIAAAIAVALVVLVIMGHAAPWWLLPAVVILALGYSLWRATR